MVKKKKKKSTKKKTAPAKKPAQDLEQKKTPVVVPYPTAGRKVQEFEDRLDQQLAAGDDAEKRGRGRPRKEAEPAPAEIDVKVIGQAIQIPFDLWSVSQGVEELKITDQESILIAKPAKQLIDYYLPQVPEIAWAWISLAAVSYSIMKSRLELIAVIKKNKAISSTKSAEGQRERKLGISQSAPSQQGQGSPGPSASFPTIKDIKNPVT